MKAGFVRLCSPLSSDLASRIVGRIRKTMYHESRSRILARFQVLLEKGTAGLSHSFRLTDVRYVSAARFRRADAYVYDVLGVEFHAARRGNSLYHAPKNRPAPVGDATGKNVIFTLARAHVFAITQQRNLRLSAVCEAREISARPN